MPSNQPVNSHSTSASVQSPSAWNTVAIIGVGLIGGSIGLALNQRGLARQIIGIGRRPASLRTAKKMGAVTRTTLDLAKGVSKADLIVVCTPVGRLVQDVRQAAAHAPAGALLTDVGSVKQLILDGVRGKVPPGKFFVGSHPIAGSEKRGPQAASADLFEDRVTVVTPDDLPDSALQENLASCLRVSAFWKSLGSRVVQMSAADHDKALACTSHLPHLTAAALAASTPANLLNLTGGGWQDTTRIAAGDASLWADILLANRDGVLRCLTNYELSLAELRHSLDSNNRRTLLKQLEKAKRNRDALGS